MAFDSLFLTVLGHHTLAFTPTGSSIGTVVGAMPGSILGGGYATVSPAGFSYSFWDSGEYELFADNQYVLTNIA